MGLQLDPKVWITVTGFVCLNWIYSVGPRIVPPFQLPDPCHACQ